MKKLISILVLVCLSTIIYCQIPEIKWQKCFGTIDYDGVECITETENGYLVSIYIYTDGPGITNFHGGVDAWIINIDETGNIIWEKCFGGSNGESIIKIIKTLDNNYYLFGGSNSNDGDISCDTVYGSSDFWVVKIDGEGSILWDHCYGSPTTDYARDAVATPDGGLLFMGRIFSQGGDVQTHYGSYDVWLCKIDSLGTLEWEKTIGNEDIDSGVRLELISDTTFAFIGGYYESGGMIDCEVATTGEEADLWLVEMDLKGNILNQYCYGGSYNDLGHCFEKINDGYILASSTNSNDGDVSGLHGSPNYHSDIWVVRINEQGEIIWQRCLGGTYSEFPAYITQIEDGGFIIIGNTFSHNGDVSNNHSWQGGGYWADIWVVKLSPEGELEWEQCYGGAENERFWGMLSVVKKSDYNYIFNAQARMNLGDVQCEMHGDIDAWVFEIDLEDTTGIFDVAAVQDGVRVYPNPGRDYVVFELPITANNKGVILNQGAGNSGGVRNPLDMTGNGKSGDSSPAKAGFGMTGTDGMTGVEGMTVVILNVLGQKVAEIVETIYPPSLKLRRVIWDFRDVKSGVYFYRMEIDNKLYSGKIVVQK